MYADIGIQPHVFTALIKEADGTFAATAHNHWTALLDVVEKARYAIERYHLDGEGDDMAEAMGDLDSALADLQKGMKGR